MKTTIRIGGMTCINCQKRIQKKLKSLSGVEGAAVDYAAGSAKVTYDEAAIDLASIKNAIEKLGYTTPENAHGRAALQIAATLGIILALAFLLRAFSTSSIAVSFPLAKEGMAYGMLLVIGLLTSIHCVAMCGGINLSQSLNKIKNNKEEIKKQNEHVNQIYLQVNASEKSQSLFSFSPFLFPFFISPVLYNCGRVISYTAVGIAVGALGSVITISDLFRNIILLIAGLLMLIMGINMLGLFPFIRRFTQMFKKSVLPQFFPNKINTQKPGRGPLVVGILNGFMPCGPLQAMQLYALSTASPIKGGLSMFLFCLGTIPLMFALGAAGGILSGVKGSAFSRRAMQTGAILVAAMGIVMFTNGWSGAGIGSPGPVKNAAIADAPAQDGGAAQNDTSDTVIQNDLAHGNAEEETTQENIQIINSTLLPRRYPAITVQQGVPVRWIINAPRGSINGCNNRFIIREYGIQHTFKYGDNVIEFTPEKAGSFTYNCWMSMIRSTITVLES